MSRYAILAHGKNWELPVPPDPAKLQLSIESEITAEAAGTLYGNGIGDLIVFSGGFTAGQAYPSEAAKMGEALRSQFTESQIPRSKVVLEEDSYDTAENLVNAKELMSELDVDSFILLSVGYHLPRVKKLAKLLDIPVAAAYKSDYVLREKYGGTNHLYAEEVMSRAIGKRSVRPLVRAAV